LEHIFNYYDTKTGFIYFAPFLIVCDWTEYDSLSSAREKCDSTLWNELELNSVTFESGKTLIKEIRESGK
jgi:hypothetical protein